MEFGKWLGKSNADTMLGELLRDATREQARAAVTVYCMLLDIDVDTRAWDDLMRDIFILYNSWFDNEDEMDNYMAEHLV